MTKPRGTDEMRHSVGLVFAGLHSSEAGAGDANGFSPNERLATPALRTACQTYSGDLFSS